MRWTIKWIFVLAVVLESVSVGAQTVKMAVFKLEPFMMTDSKSNRVVGVTIDYWKQFIAPKMGVDLEVVGIYPILRAQELLKTGRVDVVSQLTKISDREAQFLYPKTALTSIISCLVVKKDSALQEVRHPQDLYGRSLAFIKAAYIPDMLIHDQISLELVTTTDFRRMNYTKLQRNRVDAMLDINFVSMKYWLIRNGHINQIRFIMLPVAPQKVFSIFRKTREGAKLRDAFDQANQAGIAQGIFDQISKTYIEQ